LERTLEKGGIKMKKVFQGLKNPFAQGAVIIIICLVLGIWDPVGFFVGMIAFMGLVAIFCAKKAGLIDL